MSVLKVNINLHFSLEAPRSKGFPLGFNNATALFRGTMTNPRPLDGCSLPTEVNSKNVKGFGASTTFLPNSSGSPARHDQGLGTRAEDVLKEIPISPAKSSQVPPSSAKRGFEQRFHPGFGRICPLQRGKLQRETMKGEGTELRHFGA